MTEGSYTVIAATISVFGSLLVALINTNKIKEIDIHLPSWKVFVSWITFILALFYWFIGGISIILAFANDTTITQADLTVSLTLMVITSIIYYFTRNLGKKPNDKKVTQKIDQVTK